MTKDIEADVAIEIGALASLDLRELRERWQDSCGNDAPRKMSPQLLRLATAYSIQEKAFGGLSKALRAQLEAAAFRGSKDGGTRPSKPSPRNVRYHYKPGTRLLREWQGRTHEVIVVEDGDFLYAGARYRSLSKIAREITGTQWSGPGFFGLKQMRELTAKSDGDFHG